LQNVSFGHWPFPRIFWIEDGLTQAELSDEAGLMDPTTFTGLKAMEKKRYIQNRKRIDNPKVIIYLTP
jgi:DNA-binding MarR family transcriptional regulator|tara:strand:- start:402 stop:605 length:204 start_codon:yes stop_codon:yes gene_type:complete